MIESSDIIEIVIELYQMDKPSRFTIDEFINNPTQEESAASMATHYELSKKRLEQCRERQDKKPLLNYILTSVYGETDDEINQLTEVDKEKRVRKHIYQDLLLTTLYQPNGEPSELNLKIAHAFNTDKIDPDDYEPIPKNWNATKSILSELAPINYGRGDSYSGHLNMLESDKVTKSEDDVERYALKFTTDGQSPAAIALPFTVDLGYSCRIDNNSGDFVEPFGGSSCSRIVFLKKSS